MGSVFALKPYQLKPRYIPKTKKHEENLQRAICNYIRRRYPAVTFRSDYASGLRLTKSQASINKSLQSGRAFPDMAILMPSRNYHSLYIELKKDNTAIYVTRGSRKGQLVANEHIVEQALMLDELNRLGFLARFGIGYDKTTKLIDWYLNPDYKELEAQELF